MKIVIDIEDYDREWIANGYHIPDEINSKIADAIIIGTPLPAKHGRLIDADRLTRAEIMHLWYHLPNGDIACPKVDIDHDPTIIEGSENE